MSIEPTLTRPTAPAPEVADKTFATSKLPWLVAAVALVMYGLTLNKFVTFGSLGIVARVSGWMWQPETTNPVYWLLTLPVRWLPQQWTALALNSLSMACAVWTLALLARSVALLPHDRTEAQRIREKSTYSLLSLRTAWLPSVFAVLVCGLQLSFWENATVASQEMLNLLLFAYVIRGLLEFRLNGRHSWLYRAAVMYAAGMTNDALFIGLLPFFIMAVIWIKGFSFFDTRFLLRMILFGLAGLLFYLLLPAVQSVWGKVDATFWQVLKENLSAQKNFLFQLKAALFHPEVQLWVLALPSLVPVFVMAIRWPAYFGDPSKLGVALTSLVFHVFHVAMLALCLWVALDPEKFSPRHLTGGSGFLQLYYLGALSVGYYAGYVLLVFGTRPASRLRKVSASFQFSSVAVKAAVWLLLLLVPGMLVCRNATHIEARNGSVVTSKPSLLEQYASLLAKSLPQKSSIVLADERTALTKTWLLEAYLAKSGAKAKHVFIQTRYLELAEYYRYLKRRYPDQWKIEPAKNAVFIGPFDIVRTLLTLDQQKELYYLEPSFGYYFESFRLEPIGLVYRMRKYDQSLEATPGKDVIDLNQAFWQKVGSDVQKIDAEKPGTVLARMIEIVRRVTEKKPENALDRVMARLHLKPEVDSETMFLAGIYSRGLNYWGVVLQRLGRYQDAAKFFARSQDLYPGNAAAKANLALNADLQTRKQLNLDLQDDFERLLGGLRTWDQALNFYGPYDVPTACYMQGRSFHGQQLYIQAAQDFRRVNALVPELPTSLKDDAARIVVLLSMLDAHLRLADCYNMAGFPDKALQVIEQIGTHTAFQNLGRTNLADIMYIHGYALLTKTNLAGAEQVIGNALSRYPDDEELLRNAAQLYMSFRHYSNALAIIERELKLDPTSPDLLCNKGFAFLQLTNYVQAIPPLTQVIETWANPNSTLRAIAETNAAATAVYHRTLLNRAIAHLQLNQLDEADADYATLDKIVTNSFQIQYGLGEVAFRKNNKSEAIRQYERYLANGRTNSTEFNFVSNRLMVLKGGR